MKLSVHACLTKQILTDKGVIKRGAGSAMHAIFKLMTFKSHTYKRHVPTIFLTTTLGNGLEHIMQVYTPKEAYITLKDLKEDFKSKKPCRVINGAKTDVGKII